MLRWRTRMLSILRITMINMNFWHKAESLHLRISKLGFWDGCLYTKSWQKGDNHFCMVETVGRGEDHNTYIVYGCWHTCKHLFPQAFPKMYRAKCRLFPIGNCAIYCSNVVSCWCFTCLEPVTQLRWVMEVQMENCWKNAVHYRVIEYCQPRTTPSKIINMPPEKGPFQKDISSSKYPIFSRNFRFATKNAAVKKPPAKPDSSPRTRWSPRMKFPWPWPPRRSNGDVNALPKIKCRLLRQVRFWGGQWWVARRGGKDGSQARDSL